MQRITCDEHRDAITLDGMGTCPECGEEMSSMSFSICAQCAYEAEACQICLTPIETPA